MVSEYWQYVLWFRHKAEYDGRTCDSQDRASIAASRGKNEWVLTKAGLERELLDRETVLEVDALVQLFVHQQIRE